MLLKYIYIYVNKRLTELNGFDNSLVSQMLEIILMMRNIFIVFSGSTAWIGGSDKDSEGTWMWLDTEDPFTYFNWAAGKKRNILRLMLYILPLQVSFSDHLLQSVSQFVFRH